MAALLLLSHGVLGALAVAAAFLKAPWRARMLVGLCLVGAGFGIALIAFGGSLEEWRTSTISDSTSVIGTALAAAWLVAAVVSAPAGRFLACGLVGVAASALALATTNEWVVPALLFWLCSTLAVAALASELRGGPWVWVALFASDAALVAALLGNWVDTRSWTLPEALDGWPFYILLLAVVLRAGAVPLAGAWSLLGRAAPAIPLLVGGAFGLLPVALGDADPWAATVLFALALGVALVALVARTPWGGIGAVAAPYIAVMLGAAIISPPALAAAGIAAVLGGSAAALWLASSREGAPERALLLVALPPSLGFVAVASAVVAAISQTMASEEIVDKVPWTTALVLGPLALAANLALAARVVPTVSSAPGWLGRVRRADRGSLAVLVLRLMLAFSVVGAFLPGDWLGISSAVSLWEERRALLLGTALVLGLAAAWWVTRRAAARLPERPKVPTFKATAWLDAPPSGVLAGRLLVGVGLLLAVAAIGVVGWLAFEGLRLGFL